MNIDLLIKMANEIGFFWEGEVGADKAANDVATHIKRYWEPRMRAQMLTYFEQRQGAGLSDVALRAVSLLASQAKSAATAAGGTPAPQEAAPKP